VEKPSAAFFERLAAAAGRLPGRVVYVGGRVDNDVGPALAAGMVAVFLRRGPWGHLFADHPGARRAHLRVESLAELPAAIAAWNPAAARQTPVEPGAAQLHQGSASQQAVIARCSSIRCTAPSRTVRVK
jgi:HAD-hyrolase-like